MAIRDSYDYIVVGGGSSGAAAAPAAPDSDFFGRGYSSSASRTSRPSNMRSAP